MINIFPLSLFWYCDRSKTYFVDYTRLIDYVAVNFRSPYVESFVTTVNSTVDVFQLLPFSVQKEELHEHTGNPGKLLYGFKVRPRHNTPELISSVVPLYFYITDIIHDKLSTKVDLSSIEKWILVPGLYNDQKFKNCKLVVINDTLYGI